MATPDAFREDNFTDSFDDRFDGFDPADDAELEDEDILEDMRLAAGEMLLDR